MFLKIHDWSFFAVWLAQVDKRRSVEREVAGSTYYPDQHLGGGLLMLSRKCCLSKDICKAHLQTIRLSSFLRDIGDRIWTSWDRGQLLFSLWKMWQNAHLTKTDHCKYLREESLKNIHAAKKKLEFKPTWSQSNATRNNAWQDFFIACWTTL